MDVLIRNAQLRTEGDLMDVAIEGDTIQEVAVDLGGSADRVIDADGGLVLPPFVETHAHLDHAYIHERAPSPRREGTHAEAVERNMEAKESATFEGIKEHARRAAEHYVMNGATKIRSHVAVDDIWGMTALEAVLELREELSHLADIQIIVMPFEPPFSEEQYERVEQGLEMGGDLVGGRPDAEDTDDLAQRLMDEYLAIAMEHDVDLDFHIDATTDSFSRGLEYLAHRTIEEGYQGRVNASHACALATYNEQHRKKVIDMLERADMEVNVSPKEELMMPDMTPTAVRELLAADVNLSVANNAISQAFYPFGKGDLREATWLLINALAINERHEWEQLVDCMTDNPAQALGLEDYGVEPGCTADLVVHSEGTIREMFQHRSPIPYVLKDGRVVVENTLTTEIADA